MRLSIHAEEMWRKRVGDPIPGPDELVAMLSEAVRIQKATDLFTARGFRVRILALYWHPDHGVVLKVDPDRDKVVTVLSPAVAGTLDHVFNGG